MPLEFWNEVLLELIKTLLSGAIVGMGWFVGQRMVAYWDERKKQQELDLTAAREFHSLYGEFKDVSRLWRIVKYEGPDKKSLSSDTRSDLLRRASSAEGRIESMIVKLSSERVLTDEEIAALGLFRQAYQQLRMAIRDDRPFEWIYESPEYHLYNALATRVARVIAATTVTRQDNTDGAIDTLSRVTAIRPNAWTKELERFKLRHRSVS